VEKDMMQAGPYEPGMRIIYDVLTKSVVISFRGEIKMLGPFPDRSAGISAAEDFCRARGWANGETD
jgi:hypothetical protein